MATIGDKIAGALKRDENELMGLLMDEADDFPDAITQATPGDGLDADPNRPDAGDRAIYHAAIGAAWAIATMEHPFATAEELRELVLKEAVRGTASVYAVEGGKL